MLANDLPIKRSADFSPDRKYRYTLIREWDESKPRCLFILLNPSTADEQQDDPTNRRGIRYAIDWGYGACIFCNLFAIRTPYPKVMKVESEPVGSDNDLWIQKEHAQAGITVAAWGTHGSHRGRDKQVLGLLSTVHHLGLTKHGHPKHILYLAKTLTPQVMKK